MHLASGEVPGTFLRDSRAWPDADWDAGVSRLVDRGLVEVAGAQDDPASVGLTGEGVSVRQGIEDATDRLAVFPYEALGDDACAELRTLTRPFSRAVVDAAGLGR